MRSIKKKRQMNGDKTLVYFMNFCVIATSIIVIYPLYFVIIASISDPVAVNNGDALFWPIGLHFRGYRYIFGDQRIWTGYLNTVIYTVGGSCVGLMLTILGGYALSRDDMPGSRIIMKLMIFTMYFSGGLIPTYMLVKRLGLIDTRQSLILLGSFSVYNLVVARTFFKSKIPKELFEAANVDGCGNGRFFCSIVLPLSKEILAVIGLFYAVSHWNSFFNAMIYVNKQSLYPLQLFLRDMLIASESVVSGVMDIEVMMEQQKIAETIKYGVIIVSSIPVLLLYPFLQRYFVRGIMIGGIKG